MKIPTNGNGQLSLDKLIEEMKAVKFWGSLELTIQNGEVTFVKKTETAKIMSNGGTPHYDHERR